MGPGEKKEVEKIRRLEVKEIEGFDTKFYEPLFKIR
jgi:hypothetical protein